ncbi:transcriptional repressor [bacterium]|nr:transcriptional repressor [bacterium]
MFEAYKKYLKAKGMRDTIQRKILLAEIAQIDQHFDVDFLYMKLRKKEQKVSRATIYRAIPVFIDCGLLQEVTRLNNKIFYELVFKRKHHDHLICEHCGRIVEFRNDKIEHLLKLICTEHNFLQEHHQLTIYGLCNECRGKGNDKATDGT